jgi:DNA-binding beta-propeller fold protein YncE
LYTVEITATLDDQTVKKTYEFLGRESSFSYNQYEKKKVTYDISKSSFTGSLDISGTVTTPEGLIFSPDGTKMFVPDNNDDKINQFTLGTAWDISTATQSATSAATGEGGTDEPEDLAFNSDGTKMFIIERHADKILEYNLSIPYDVSSSSMTDADDDLTIANAVTNNPEDLAFDPTGTIMFLLENDDQVTGDQVFEYSLSTAFDVSTATLVSGEHLTLTDSTNADAFEFSSDGEYLYVADPAGDDTLLQYTMSRAWDVSSATLTRSFDISNNSADKDARGLAFGDTGNKFYLTGTSDAVWQYDLG